MMHQVLATRLEPLLRRQHRLMLWRRLAGCWALAAVVGLALMLLRQQSGWHSPWVMPALMAVAVVAALGIAWRQRRFQPDIRWLARQIEQRYPDLQGLVLTAVQQQAKDGAEFSYLQQRVLTEAVAHSENHAWKDAIAPARLRWAQALHFGVLAFFAFVLWGLHRSVGETSPAPFSLSGLTVTPGDTSIERGNNLVVLARFTGSLPATVDLVVNHAAEGAQRIPLVKSLADPVFGGSVPNVRDPFVYHVEGGGKRSANFRVRVFEHPRLERADAELTFPDYTGLSPKRIEDTRRLSAVEGTRLDLALQFNKPVAVARLVAKGKEPSVVSLQVETNRPAALLKRFPLEASKTYELQLVDADGRTNKVPAQLVFDVLQNRPPELRLTTPRGDLRPSALEEITFAGTVWDDYGVHAFGLAYALAGQETRFIELGRDVPAREKRAFRHLLRLEEFGVQPQQLLTWFAWAEDIGPDGQVRRTTGDLYFAEVRPFDEIFREGQGLDNAASANESGEQSQQGNATARLAELQKQVISATWKLQRENLPAGTSTSAPDRRKPETGGGTRTPTQYTNDLAVVRDGQAQALAQARDQKERAEDLRSRTSWDTVTKEMTQALVQLTAAARSPEPLPQALTAEQAAYQALLKAQTREYEVTRARNRNQRRGGQQQGLQRQLDQLDLTQSENRYETQRQASPPQNAERREQLQVLSRLQDLARRQHDVNERLKELQTALQEARTEPDREEARRQLKRLQEEEQQMLADMDELRQRLERPENQSRMGQERQRLDDTRNDVRRAAEAAGQGAASQALASGTRAQRQLQELRDDLRRNSSSQLADDLRQMRLDARELSRQQENIAKEINTRTGNRRPTLSDSTDREDLLRQLARQKERITNLVDRATQLSQQADNTEPLLSRQLYDTLRQFSQDEGNNLKEFQEELLRRGLMTGSLYQRLRDTAERDGAKSLELTAEMLRQGYLPHAQQAQQRARASIDDLKQGVERAAESVLGDDTEALRRAQQELDQLTNDLQREMAQAESGPRAEGSSSPDPNARPNGSSQPERRAGGNTQPGSGAPAPSENQRRPGGQPNAPAQARNDRPGTTGGAVAPRDGATRGGGRDVAWSGGGGGGGGNLTVTNLDRILNPAAAPWTGPLAGEDFAPWSDRLRDVEDMLDFLDLRSDVAAARERARLVRLESKRDLKKPDWAVVQLQIVKPLVEVRNRIGEELARRESKDPLVPIDRDPVPHRYSELVRRYYEELGKAK